MPDEAAVLDAAPEIDLGSPDGGEQVSEVETDGPEASLESPESTETESESGLTGAQTWKSIKEPLKALDPKTMQTVRKALFKLDELQKHAPEGLSKLTSELSVVRRLADDPDAPDAVPIEQLVANTLEERAFWREFDGKFEAGDPSLVQQMADANPDGFQKLIPAALHKFNEVNPDGYAALVAGPAIGYLDSQNIQLQFTILDTFIAQLPDSPASQQVIKACQAIYAATEGLRALSKKPVQPVGGNPSKTEKPAEPNTDIAERELRITDKEWNGDVAPKSNQLAGEEAVRIAGKTKFTEQELQTIRSKVREEINARISMNQPYQKALRSYLQAGNKAAYVQRVLAEHKKIITGGAVRRAVDDVLAKRPAGVKKAPQAPPNAQQKTPNAPLQQANERFEVIAGPPSTMGLRIDHRRTDQRMLLRREAYVVGRKNPVKWKQPA